MSIRARDKRTERQELECGVRAAGRRCLSGKDPDINALSRMIIARSQRRPQEGAHLWALLMAAETATSSGDRAKALDYFRDAIEFACSPDRVWGKGGA